MRTLHSGQTCCSRSDERDDDIFIFNDAKPLALGGLVGTSVEWNRLGMSVRYVTDITNSLDEDSTAPGSSVRNHGVMVLLTAAAHRRPK